MKVKIGGAFYDVAGGNVLTNTGWRPLARIRSYVSAEWKDGPVFAEPLEASVSPGELGGFSFVGVSFTTDAATVTPVGGIGPFTYSWTQLSGDDEIEPVNATSATTSFVHEAGYEGEYQTVFECVCTDANGQTASVQVTVSITIITYTVF